MLRKYLLAVLMLTVLKIPVSAEERNPPIRMGFQFSSDSFTGLELYSDFLELSLKAQALQIDGEAKVIPVLLFGGNAGFVFNPFEEPTSLSLGAEIRTGLGTDEPDYAEYIDAGVRLGINHMVSRHIMLSALYYPVWLSTREQEGAKDWGMVITLSKAAVAVSYLF